MTTENNTDQKPPTKPTTAPVVIGCSDLLAISYKLKSDYEGMNPSSMTFHRMNSPFYDGEKWAVRMGGNCLNKEGEWEWEPSPSNREDDFYSRCRFESKEDAIKAVNLIS